MRAKPSYLLLLVLLMLAVAVAVTSIHDDAEGASFITLTAALQSRTMHGAGPAGRLGDVTEQAWFLRDRNGRTVGRLFLFCHWTTNRIRLCMAEARLPGGTLVGMGATNTRLSGTFAVAGGTGRYRHSDGEASFQATGIDRLIVRIALE